MGGAGRGWKRQEGLRKVTVFPEGEDECLGQGEGR